MTKLFVANTSQQKCEFIFRLPESRTTSPPLTINPGTQAQIYQDTTSDVIDHIVEQHRRYGMKHVNEIGKGFAGLVYAIDAPVRLDDIFLAEEANIAALENLGSEVRQAQAAALSQKMEEIGVDLKEVLVSEDVRPGVDSKVEETIAIEKPARSRK